MHVKKALRPGLFVQVVHVLRAEEQALAELALEVGQGEMGSIRPARGGLASPFGVEAPDELGVSGPALGRSHVFEAVLLPQAVGVPKRPDAALGADARSRQHEHPSAGRKSYRSERAASPARGARATRGGASRAAGSGDVGGRGAGRDGGRDAGAIGGAM